MVAVTDDPRDSQSSICLALAICHCCCSHVGTEVGGDEEGRGKMTTLLSSLALTCYISHLCGGDMSHGQTQVQLGGDV